MQTAEEKEIIEKLKSGNKQEINLGGKMLFESPIFQGIAASIVSKNNGDYGDIPILFQESITILYQRVVGGKFRGESKLSTYFYGICRIVYYKMKKKRITDELKEDVGYFLLQDVEATYLERERMKKIKRAAQKACALVGEPCKTLLESRALGIRYEDILPNLKHLFSSVTALRQKVMKCRRILRKNSDFQTLTNEIL